MSRASEEISPKNVYNHIKTRLANHYFFSPNTGKKCRIFLKWLQITEKCLNEKKRTIINSKLSNLTIDLWGMMLKDALDALDDADKLIHSDTIQ